MTTNPADYPTRAELEADERAPDPRDGMRRCPNGCAVWFHHGPSIAYEAHVRGHGEVVIVPLSATKPPLSLNDRMHWAAKARIVAELRHEVAVRAQALPTLDAAVVTLHYRPKQKRARDHMNLAATLKPCVDGLVDAGVIPDDSDEYLDDRIVIHAPEKGQPGALWLSVEARP